MLPTDPASVEAVTGGYWWDGRAYGTDCAPTDPASVERMTGGYGAEASLRRVALPDSAQSPLPPTRGRWGAGSLSPPPSAVAASHSSTDAGSVGTQTRGRGVGPCLGIWCPAGIGQNPGACRRGPGNLQPSAKWLDLDVSTGLTRTVTSPCGDWPALRSRLRQHRSLAGKGRGIRRAGRATPANGWG